VADRTDQIAARVQDAGQGGVEVFDAKKQTDPAGELAPDDGGLVFIIGAGEYEAGVRTWNDPVGLDR
jgi:hypothetical protein